jgi:chromosomal replication initiation ATPase DnaA
MTAADQIARAKELKAKFYGPIVPINKSRDPEAGTVQSELRRLRNENEAHKKTIKLQAEQIERLRLDIADLEAAFLCQAHMMVDAFRAASAEAEKVARRSPRQIIEALLERNYPHVSFYDVISPRRSAALIEPRHKCMAAVYVERKDMSFSEIGRVFDRDRTTIIHAVEKEGAKRVGK